MQHLKQEKTFVLIKPDGVKKGLIGEVISRFEQRDLKIGALEMFQPTRQMIDDHYPKDMAWIERLRPKTLSTDEKYGLHRKWSPPPLPTPRNALSPIYSTRPRLPPKRSMRSNTGSGKPLYTRINGTGWMSKGALAKAGKKLPIL